jgi:Sulfotransferase family
MSSVPAQKRVRPLFLMALPRSGSTLVQRVLAAHPQIATASEPWLLLPFFYARRASGVRAEYCHQVAAEAVQDFAEALEGGVATFDGRLRQFVDGVYQDAAGDGATYFLDKTPHYHFIVDDLARLFPEAKLLFLWRNPLALLASLMETFRRNRFEPYEFNSALVRGPRTLATAFERNRERAHAVRFEDLIGNAAESHWRGVFEYLELDWDPTVLQRFSGIQLQGRFGDPTGVNRYGSLSSEPLEKWRDSFRGRVRQEWAVRWLSRLGRRPLSTMGYDLDALVRETQSAGDAPPAAVAADALLLARSAAHELVRRRALRVSDTPRPLGPLFETRRPRHEQLLQAVRRLSPRQAPP